MAENAQHKVHRRISSNRLSMMLEPQCFLIRSHGMTSCFNIEMLSTHQERLVTSFCLLPPRIPLRLLVRELLAGGV